MKMKAWLIVLVFVVNAMSNMHAAPVKFVHPGTVLTKEQMTFAYDQVTAGKEPWKTTFVNWTNQYKTFLDSNYSPNAKSDIARTVNKWAYENDAMAMFVNGVMWNMTGNDRYAEKVVQLLNAWDTTWKNFPDGTDFALMFGYGLQFMVYGADMIHDYNGFNAEERGRAHTFLTAFKDRVISAYTKNGSWPFVQSGWPSWGSGLGRFLMAYSVYAEDTVIYNASKDYFFRSGAQGGDNGTIMTAFLNSGEGLEMGRDIYYSQLSLGSFLEWSRIAFNQGDSDLFEARDGVLGKAMEYLGKYNLGDSVTWEPFYQQADVWAASYPISSISTGNRGSWRGIWYLAYDYYHNSKGLPMPYTTRVVDSAMIFEGTSSTVTDQVGFGSLFFNNSQGNPTPLVYLYNNIDYDHFESALPLGDYTLSKLGSLGMTDNSVSSLKLSAGLQVELFDDDNFMSSLGSFTSDLPDLVALKINDMVTSIRISMLPSKTTLWNKGNSRIQGIYWSNGILTLNGIQSGTLQVVNPQGRTMLFDVIEGVANVARLSPGLYMARMSDDPIYLPRKFVVLP